MAKNSPIPKLIYQMQNVVVVLKSNKINNKH